MTAMTEHFDANTLRRFRRNLPAWYKRSARDLPWRRTADPYAVWVSEIMLQQTTVAAVVGYFKRFLARFPNVHALAAADEQEVLRAWEGLGYYRRARNMHRAAKILVENCDGEFPTSVAKLRELPGIGRYTAGAIASFAYDARAPILEANTLRLYSRLIGYRGNPQTSDGQRLLWDFAERVLPRRNPGTFNQALMELGSTVCTPADPRCRDCPVRSCCRAFAENAQHEIPLAAPRQQFTHLTEAAVAVKKNGAYLLRRCGPGERWSGLWDFQRFTVENGHVDDTLRRTNGNGDNRGEAVNPALRSFLETSVHDRTGLVTGLSDLLTVINHGVTRYRIRLLCYSATYLSGRLRPGTDSQWVKPAAFTDYPLSTTGRRLARMLAKRDLGE